MSLYPNSTTAHFRVTQCCFLSSLRRPTPRFSPHACQSLAVSQESTQDCKCRRTSNRICSSSARIAYCLARGDSQQVSPPRLHSIHILYYTLIICCGLWKADGGLNWSVVVLCVPVDIHRCAGISISLTKAPVKSVPALSKGCWILSIMKWLRWGVMPQVPRFKPSCEPLSRTSGTKSWRVGR